MYNNFLILLDKYRNKFKYLVEDHNKFIEIYKKNPLDFIYDKSSGLYLIESTGIKHAAVMAEFYEYYTNTKFDDDYYNASDKYIEEGYGMFKSRAGHIILCGKTFKVPDIIADNIISRDIERMI